MKRIMSGLRTDEAGPQEHNKIALHRICRELVDRSPLLLSLIVVAGCIAGGVIGGCAVCMALVAGLMLHRYRTLSCALLCGGVVILSQALRTRCEQHFFPSGCAPAAVQLEGTVVATLNHGCILETGWTGVRVALYSNEARWQLGDKLRVVAAPLPPTSPPVSGMFSQERWMRGQGLAARLSFLQWENTGISHGRASLMRVAGYIREALSNRLMPPGTRNDIRRQVLCALVLGEKERADESTTEIFRRGGCLHVFAVSGLHVGIVAGICWFLLRLCHVRPLFGRYVQLTLVGMYVLATGLAVPALRAYLMLAILMGGMILRRRTSFLNAWCFAAILILMLQPWQLFQPGFQLSFIVYGAICLGVRYGMGKLPWFGPDTYIPARLRTRSERLTSVVDLFVRGAVVVSLSAWLVALPLTIFQFHVVNTMSYLINILLAPLLPVVMFAGLLVLAAGWLPLLGGWIHTVALCTTGWLIALVDISGTLPGAYLPAAPAAPPMAFMAVDLGYGKSFTALGNPGLFLGDVQRLSTARYMVQPALFHAGFSPLLCVNNSESGAIQLYQQSWPQLRVLVVTPGDPPRRFSTDAGSFTIYAPPAGIPGKFAANLCPVILWERADGKRILYVGNAALSTLETIPPKQRIADVLILGYNAHEPIIDTEYVWAMRIRELILLPSTNENWMPREKLPGVEIRTLSAQPCGIIR